MLQAPAKPIEFVNRKNINAALSHFSHQSV
jgi:hypothetical protein